MVKARVSESQNSPCLQLFPSNCHIVELKESHILWENDFILNPAGENMPSAEQKLVCSRIQWIFQRGARVRACVSLRLRRGAAGRVHVCFWTIQLRFGEFARVVLSLKNKNKKQRFYCFYWNIFFINMFMLFPEASLLNPRGLSQVPAWKQHAQNEEYFSAITNCV